MKKFAIFLLICIQVIFIGRLPGRATAEPAITKAKKDSIVINSAAPEFSLRDLEGKWYSLKDLKGKVVVLNFWFIACKPCVNEIPVLNAIKNKYDPEKVVFLALSLDRQEAIRYFLKNNRFEYTILPDAEGVAEKYNLNAYPASMVIDNNGIIRFIQIGGPNIGQNLTEAINAIHNEDD